MAKVFEYFGEELVNKSGSVLKSSEVRGKGKVLAVYFSAHWCPPCRGFTPQLADFYNKVKAGPNADKFELVFVSSDKDQAAFDEYLNTMPWWALPFEKRDLKAQLSKHFHVSGIPSLVFLDGSTGKILNKNGRAEVGSDPEGKNFPWRAKTLFDMLKDGEFINNKSEAKTFEEDIKGKVLGIYFSAHWCPPCKSFTPVLCETYKTINSEVKKFEVIFASSDRSEKAFKEYFSEMPFLALPFDSELKNELSEHFEIGGIPTLVIVDENGKVITSNGRESVGGDTEGKKFPWYPEPVEDLDDSSVNKLNEETCLVYFPGGDEECCKQMKDILKPLGEAAQAQAKADDVGQDLYFLVASPTLNELLSSVCEFLKVNGDDKTLLIVDIPSGKYYKAEKQENTKENVEKFVKDFREGKLTAQAIGDDE